MYDKRLNLNSFFHVLKKDRGESERRRIGRVLGRGEREREREWGQSERYIGFIIIVLKFFLIFKILKSTKKNEIFLLFSFCVCVCVRVARGHKKL
jgi:hypothetical protein